MEDIVKLVQCPCCFDVPRPGPNNSIGLCERGHIICHNCTVEVLKVKQECPICRSESLALSTSNYIANGLMRILTGVTVYRCKFDNCDRSFVGDAIIDHEKCCEMKPIKCPKYFCGQSEIIGNYLKGEHPCILPIAPLPMKPNIWETTVNIEDIFSIDDYRVRVQTKFQPRLLQTSSASTNDFNRIFIGIANYTHQSVIVYNGWLNRKEDTHELITKLRGNMYVFVHTSDGSVGFSNSTRLMFETNLPTRANDGVYLNIATLSKWLYWTTRSKCPKCPTNMQPHMHIRMSL